MDDNIMNSKDFQRCVNFHGHVCGGLALGYRAAKEGLAWLEEHRSLDEELVAIVENDACGVDAVQVLTGCTFGKGNFFFKDYGKMAFTFFSRKTEKGVRLAPKGKGMGPSDEMKALFEKLRNDTATNEDRERLAELGNQMAQSVLNAPIDTLFSINPADVSMPERAWIHSSIVCYKCQEPTMATRVEDVDGKKICKRCLELG